MSFVSTTTAAVTATDDDDVNVCCCIFHVNLVCSRELASVVRASAALISFQCMAPSCTTPLQYRQFHTHNLGLVNTTGINPAGDAGTHPRYFGWGTSLGISIPQYYYTYFKFRTSEFTKTCHFEITKQNNFWGGALPRPFSGGEGNTTSPYPTIFSASFS